MMWHPRTYFLLIFISQQCFEQLNINTVDNHSKLVRTEAVLNQTISTVSPIATDVNFVAARNETEENPTKSNTGDMTIKTSGKIKGSTKSTNDVLIQSFITNTSIITYNSSKETMESSPDQNFSQITTNANTEDNFNDINDQMRLRICPRRGFNQTMKTYISWCAHSDYKVIKTFELISWMTSTHVCRRRRSYQSYNVYIHWCDYLRSKITTFELDPRDLKTRSENNTEAEETQSFITNTCVNSLNARNNAIKYTSNHSEEAMESSTQHNFNHSITNDSPEDNTNDANGQMRPRVCLRRSLNLPIGVYIYWCACNGYHMIKTLELDPIDFNVITKIQSNKREEETLTNQTQAEEEKIKEEKRRFYFKISALMWKSISPIIIVVGTVGNTLSILVMLRKRFRHTTMCFYLIALAIADTCVLYTSLLLTSLQVYLSTEFLLRSDTLCKTLNFLTHYISHIASWIIVCLTSERFVAVIFPHYCKILFTQARAAIVLAFIILILLVFDSHFFWTHHLQEYTEQYSYIDHLTMATTTHTIKQKMCSINKHIKQHYYFNKNVWPWMDMALFSLLPLVFIVVGNITICIKLGLAHYNRRNLGASTNQSQNRSKLISTAIVLVSVSLLFIISTFPITIWQFGTAYDKDAWAKQQFTGTIVFLLHYLNNAFNFVLYCLSGRQFCKELIIMLTRKSTRIHPMGGQQHRGDNIQMTGTTRNNVTENSCRTTNTNV